MRASHAHVNVKFDGANNKTTFLLGHGSNRKHHFVAPLMGADPEAPSLCVSREPKTENWMIVRKLRAVACFFEPQDKTTST